MFGSGGIPTRFIINENRIAQMSHELELRGVVHEVLNRVKTVYPPHSIELLKYPTTLIRCLKIY